MGFDQITKALGHKMRRELLVELLAHNPVQADELRESEGEKTALFHSHLPTLDDLDYIVWNRAAATITKGPNWEEIEPVVRLLSENTECLPPDTF